MDATLTFAQWLRNRRQALDLTQAGLAEAIGCAPVTIRSMEAGRRRPSQQLAELLAVALYVSSDEGASFIQWARGVGGAPPTVTSPLPVQAGAPGCLVWLQRACAAGATHSTDRQGSRECPGACLSLAGIHAPGYSHRPSWYR